MNDKAMDNAGQEIIRYLVGLWASLKLKTGVLLAGLAGGVLSVFHEKESISWWHAWVMLLTGALTAGFITPLAGRWLGLGEGLENSVGFVIGLTSMRLIELLLNIIEALSKNPKIIWTGLKELFPFSKKKK